MLDGYKELTPVVYGENAIKHLYFKDEKKPGKVCFRMHWHERMEVLRVCSGSLEVHTEEDEFCVLPGQVAVLGPCQKHAGIAGGEGVAYHAIMFDVENFCNGTMASEKYLVPICKNKVEFRTVIKDERLTAVVDKLVDMLMMANGRNPLLEVGAVYELLGLLYQYKDERVHIMERSVKGFSAILEYVNEHYVEKITSKTVSGMFGYNETYFCRRFSEVTGMTLNRYILALRMELAQKLLKNSKDEISIVAWKCGYSDVSYFSNRFKLFTGCSPTEFRGKQI